MSNDLEDSRPSPHDYIARDRIEDLWGAGFTIIERFMLGADQFDIARHVVAPGMAAQWMEQSNLLKAVKDGWRVIPSKRCRGLFAPYTASDPDGGVVVAGLILMERHSEEVAVARQGAIDAAKKLETDWAKKSAMIGLSGRAGIVGGTQTLVGVEDALIGADPAGVFVDPETKTIETMFHIPRDMKEHVHAILEERDRLAKEHVSLVDSGLESPFTAAFSLAIEADPTLAKWPALYALVLPTAIANVREKLKETASHGR